VWLFVRPLVPLLTMDLWMSLRYINLVVSITMDLYVDVNQFGTNTLYIEYPDRPHESIRVLTRIPDWMISSTVPDVR